MTRNQKPMSPPGGLVAVIGTVIVAISLVLTSAPQASVAAYYQYANAASRSEGQGVSSGGPYSMIGARAYVNGTILRVYIRNSAGGGWQLGTAWADEGSNAYLSHPQYSPAYSDCWWDFVGGSVSGQATLNCWRNS